MARVAPIVAVTLASVLAACGGKDKPATTSVKAPNAPQPGAAVVAHEEHALHNVHQVSDRLWSGGWPEGDAAFDELKSMGFKTIISVDGAAPDVKRARDRGMRYVHIPITYAEVTNPQRLEIARAIRDLPAPVYLHCHHGRHRGPAAAAAASVALGDITSEQGITFMRTAGTAPNYTGLYACVAAATVASVGDLNAAPHDFPAVRKAEGMVAAMVEVDLAWEHLGDIRAAGWTVPKEHPDLVPAAEAGRLTDNFRLSHEDPKATALGPDFMARLERAIAEASALEEGIVANAPKEQLEAAYKVVQASCKDCHAGYRDKK